MKAELVAAFKNATVRNLAIILLAVLLIMGGCEGSARLEQYRFYRFDPSAWTKAKPADRYYMAKYMVDQHMLLGKSRAEIIELLGRPDVNTGLVLYNLGPERDSLSRIDDDWLDLRFDDSERPVVNRAFIRPD